MLVVKTGWAGHPFPRVIPKAAEKRPEGHVVVFSQLPKLHRKCYSQTCARTHNSTVQFPSLSARFVDRLHEISGEEMTSEITIRPGRGHSRKLDVCAGEI